MVPAFTLIALYLSSCVAHEFGRPLGHLPSISRSFINLGKMDISIHFNGMPDTPKNMEKQVTSQQNFFSQEGDCPCTRSMNNPPMPSPFDIVNTILKNNNLFHNKMASPQCCDEHEETIYFELTPNNINFNPLNKIRQGKTPPFVFDSIIPKRPSTTRPKAVEIFLFPKRRDMMTVEYPKERPKFLANHGTLLPGNGKVQSDIKSNLPSSSVKKDLGFKPEKEGLKEELQKMRVETNVKANVV